VLILSADCTGPRRFWPLTISRYAGHMNSPTNVSIRRGRRFASGLEPRIPREVALIELSFLLPSPQSLTGEHSRGVGGSEREDERRGAETRARGPSSFGRENAAINQCTRIVAPRDPHLTRRMIIQGEVSRPTNRFLVGSCLTAHGIMVAHCAR